MNELSQWLNTGLLGLIFWFLKDYLEQQRKTQLETEKKMNEIEHNYMNRFDEVNKHLGSIDTRITEIITQMKYDRK
jgi:hypothetical protein